MRHRGAKCPFLIMGFSLLNGMEFFAAPKKGIPFSIKPPAMRVRVGCYTKNYLSVYNKVVQAKGKSALMIFDRHANLKYRFGNRHFWAEGYYVSTVGLNEATIKKYIQEQEKHDIAMDKLSVKEYEDPFKG